MKNIVLTLGAFVSASISYGSSNIVQNPSFEEGHDFICARGRTGQSIGAWFVDSGNVDIVFPNWCGSASAWAGADGPSSVDLGGSIYAPYNGSVSQDLLTTAGHEYLVRFALAGNFVASPTVKTVIVLWDSVEVGRFTFDVTGRSSTNMGWTYHEVRVRATNSTSRLTLRTPDTSGYGPVIDDVSVVAIEEHKPILSIRVSQVELCWDTLTNNWYRLQYRSTLTTNQWTPLDGTWLPGTGASYCTNDTVLIGQPQRFYQLEVTNRPPAQ